MAKVEKGKTGKPTERKTSKKESAAPQQLDQGSEESSLPMRRVKGAFSSSAVILFIPTNFEWEEQKRGTVCELILMN
ncbi:MAG: hypothetical protein HP490_01140 [Nitrospira sp.]|nr:hypothetical protein [Nitrospira sp.]